MVLQAQCLGPYKGFSSGEVSYYVNKLGTWLYVLALVIWLSRGLREARGGGVQVTLNSFVLQLGQMGCNLSSWHKLQGFQTLTCLWVVDFFSLLWTSFPYSPCWLRAETDLASGENAVALWGAVIVFCGLFRWKGWNQSPHMKYCSERQREAAWEREEWGQSPCHSPRDAWWQGKHSSAV